MGDKNDPPIFEEPFGSGPTVIDIGDARVARGRSRRPVSTCRHRQMVYDRAERRIWCKECETNIDAFDAFEQLVGQFHKAAADIEKRREAVAQAEKANITRIAAKRMEEAFRSRKHVPTCPHCCRGILPEDTERMGMCGRDYELARRARNPKG